MQDTSLPPTAVGGALSYGMRPRTAPALSPLRNSPMFNAASTHDLRRQPASRPAHFLTSPIHRLRAQSVTQIT